MTTGMSDHITADGITVRGITADGRAVQGTGGRPRELAVGAMIFLVFGIVLAAVVGVLSGNVGEAVRSGLAQVAAGVSLFLYQAVSIRLSRRLSAVVTLVVFAVILVVGFVLVGI